MRFFVFPLVLFSVYGFAESTEKYPTNQESEYAFLDTTISGYSEVELKPSQANFTGAPNLPTTSTEVQSSDYSIQKDVTLIVGLGVTHISDDEYYDYRDSKYFGTDRDNRTDISKKKLNQGDFRNNQILGLKLHKDEHSLTAITFLNSYYERTNGLIYGYSIPVNRYLTVEVGVALVYGYRDALKHQDQNDSWEKGYDAFPIASLKTPIHRFGVNGSLSFMGRVPVLSIEKPFRLPSILPSL